MANDLDIDANMLQFIRILKKLGLVSRKTYARIGQDLLFNGKGKKDAWRKANWKEFLKSG